MGFLNKLFGGPEKDPDFTPSSDLMSEDVFWDLILTSFNEAGGNPDLQEEALAMILQKLSLQDLILFQNRYVQLRGQAYTWPLWGAAYIINGGCSDDGFCYFRDWLIAQGPDAYSKALADPEWLVNLEPEGEEGAEAEGMAYVAGSVFKERTGKYLPAEFPENHEISGPEWKEEWDDLAQMFPKLWEKFGREE
ncbi:MAG TPA: DUF4240 domain-containing protein [Puia sp.]|jgi:hypothetical protein